MKYVMLIYQGTALERQAALDERPAHALGQAAAHLLHGDRHADPRRRADRLPPGLGAPDVPALGGRA